MKSLYIFATLFIASFISLTAQNFQSGTISTTNNQTYEGRVSIDNNSKKVVLKENGNNQIFSFNSIKNVEIKGQTFSIITFENNPFLANQLVSGKASLYNLSNSDYLILIENGSGKFFNIIEDKSQLPGTLSLLFNDCNIIRDEINNTEYYTSKSLTNLTQSYNNCEYGVYSPSEKELDKANTHNTDTFMFYAGLQTSFNTTTINDFNSTNTSGFGLGLGVEASPSFMQNLQGNLFFDFDFAMVFSGDNDFANGVTPLNYKQSTYRFSLGMKYLFNKEGTLQPFLGIGGGYTSDYYKGNIGSITFKDHDQNVYFTPKIGVLYQLKNDKHIGLTFSYISEYENDLSFFSINEIDEVILNPFKINTSAFTVGLSYYF